MPQWMGAGRYPESRTRKALIAAFMWWRARMLGDAPTTGAAGAALYRR